MGSLTALRTPRLSLLALFAGFFLYIGASELVPESYHAHPKLLTTAMTLLGMAVMYGMPRNVRAVEQRTLRRRELGACAASDSGSVAGPRSTTPVTPAPLGLQSLHAPRPLLQVLQCSNS
jgi:hypothetical protein